jgi:hypothetical protein
LQPAFPPIRRITRVSTSNLVKLIQPVSGVDKVQVILLGFIKCSPGWIESWFPNKEETARYAQHEIPPGEACVLTYDPEYDSRWKVSVKLESLGIVAQIVKDFTGHITEGMAWYVSAFPPQTA